MSKYYAVSLRASFSLIKGDTFSDGVDHTCVPKHMYGILLQSSKVKPRIIPNISRIEEGQGREAAGLIALIMLINCKSGITHLQLCCYCYVRL